MQSAAPTMVYTLGIGGRAIRLFAEKGVSIKTGSFTTVGQALANLDRISDLTASCKD